MALSEKKEWSKEEIVGCKGQMEVRGNGKQRIERRRGVKEREKEVEWIEGSVSVIERKNALKNGQKEVSK